MKWKNKGHIFDEIGKKFSEYRGKYYIYGAGNLGEITYQKLKHNDEILGFIDIDKTKKKCCGLTVHGLEQISNLNGRIIVAVSAHYEEVKEMLLIKGLIENVDFFSHKLINIYNLYKFDKLTLNRVDLSITNKCTLKCKYCNMFMPHFNKPQDMSLQDIYNSLDNLFNKIDFLYNFNLLGGEPFVNKDFVKILDYSSKYRNQIDKLTVFTNATILPTQEQIDIIKNNDITIQITDYTSAVNYKERLNEFIELININNIKNDFFNLGKWSDFGFPHKPSNLTNEKGLTMRFDKCSPDFRGLFGNKLYFCHLSLSAEKAELFEGIKSDYFIIDENFNKKELLEFDFGYNDIGYVSFCKLCNGCYSNTLVDSRIQL